MDWTAARHKRSLSVDPPSGSAGMTIDDRA
jgi:hypothetical protein